MGAGLANSLIFQAPAGPASPKCVVWDERPKSSPEGGVQRPFLWHKQEGAKATVIYFHGNAEDLMDVEYDLKVLSQALKANVLGVEYPGYGLCRENNGVKAEAMFPGCSRAPAQNEQCTIEGIDKAAIHALQFIVSTMGIPCSQVILLGRSLGSGTAMRLAKQARDRFHWNVGGIVLQCPYMSIKQIVSDYACSASSLFIPTYYDNMATLRELCVQCPKALETERWIPLLILHGEKDEVIWPYHAKSLYDEAVKLGHPTVEVFFAPLATHNDWDLLTDLASPISKWMLRYMHTFRGSSQRPSCFGPLSRAPQMLQVPGMDACAGRRQPANQRDGLPSPPPTTGPDGDFNKARKWGLTLQAKSI